MPKRPADRSIVAGVIAVLAVIAAVILVAIYLWPDSDPPPDAKTAPASKTPSVSVPAPKKPAPVLDFDRIDKDEPLKKLNKERKKAYGIEKEVDFIAREDETIRIGDETVPMKEILDKIRLKEGEILESDLGGGPAPRTLAEKS
ncbi:MAG: hypothetical protein GY859_12680, partial [Desulfobacterales bacterium]|nr:hypothetical protein [Desulfobacterales bacterium]